MKFDVKSEFNEVAKKVRVHSKVIILAVSMGNTHTWPVEKKVAHIIKRG